MSRNGPRKRRGLILYIIPMNEYFELSIEAWQHCSKQSYVTRPGVAPTSPPLALGLIAVRHHPLSMHFGVRPLFLSCCDNVLQDKG